MSQQLPNLIIAGVNKAGTTSLFTYLGLHPDVCISAIKETNYFSIGRQSDVLAPIAEYQQHFTHCPNIPYVIECTPSYYYGGHVTAQAMIDTLGPDLKIIIVLRDPVDRFLSDYRFKTSRLVVDEGLDLFEYIKICETLDVSKRHDPFWSLYAGQYIDYFDDWYTFFGDSLRITFLEDLKADRNQFLRDVATWMKLDPEGFPFESMVVENQTFNYRNKALQKLAYEFNSRNAKFLTAHPGIKKNIRSVYRFVNNKSFQNETPIEAETYLKYYYAPYNKQLATRLIECNYTEMPDWLSQYL